MGTTKIVKIPRGYELEGDPVDLNVDKLDGLHANQIDADKVDGKHASDLKHGIAEDDQTAIKVAIGEFGCPSVTGNYSVNVGFKPRYVEFRVARSSGNSAQIGFGWMNYYNFQNACAFAVVYPNQAMYYRNIYCLMAIDQYQNWEVGAVFVSMNSDGFTINFIYVNNAFVISYKAVR